MLQTFVTSFAITDIEFRSDKFNLSPIIQVPKAAQFFQIVFKYF